MSFVNLLGKTAGLGLLSIGFCHAAMAEDWPTFRGAARTAISNETNLLDSWSADGPELVWSTVGAGSGYASPAVAAGKVYTLGDAPSTADNGDEYLSCFDEKDGKQIMGHPRRPRLDRTQTAILEWCAKHANH